MTTSPVLTVTDELIAELEAAASYCVTEVIRSHPWSEQDFDLLRADERYVRAASPELVRALLAERAELKRDAARYRWLRDKANFTKEDAPQVVVTDWAGCPVSVSPSAYPQGDNLDKAIDAAMQAAK